MCKNLMCVFKMRTKELGKYSRRSVWKKYLNFRVYTFAVGQLFAGGPIISVLVHLQPFRFLGIADT